MGYYSTRSRRRRPEPVGTVEIVCIVLVVIAVVALLVWMITTAGGGVLMT
jgi:hypothetical protein